MEAIFATGQVSHCFAYFAKQFIVLFRKKNVFTSLLVESARLPLVMLVLKQHWVQALSLFNACAL